MSGKSFICADVRRLFHVGLPDEKLLGGILFGSLRFVIRFMRVCIVWKHPTLFLRYSSLHLVIIVFRVGFSRSWF